MLIYDKPCLMWKERCVCVFVRPPHLVCLQLGHVVSSRQSSVVPYQNQEQLLSLLYILAERHAPQNARRRETKAHCEDGMSIYC